MTTELRERAREFRRSLGWHTCADTEELSLRNIDETMASFAEKVLRRACEVVEARCEFGEIDAEAIRREFGL